MSRTRRSKATPCAGDSPIVLLDEWANHDPNHEILRLISGGSTVSTTIGGLRDRTRRVAAGLAVRGIDPGTRIGLWGDSDGFLELVAAYLGILRAGAVAVVLPPGWTPRTLEQVLDRLGVEHVVTARSTATVGGRTPLNVAQLAESPPGPEVPIRPEHPAEIVFTSGTTGPPRPVLTCHRTLCASYASVPTRTQPAAPQVYVHCLRPGSAFAQALLVDALQFCRSTIVAIDGFSPDAWYRAVERHQGTISFMVPAMAQALLAVEDHNRYDLASLGFLCMAGAPPSAGLLEALSDRFPNATIVNSYCSTEAWPAGTDSAFDLSRPTTVGRPWEGREIAIWDDNNHPLPRLKVGNVAMRSIGVTQRSYILDGDERPDLTFVDGWVRTGDRGYLDEDGYLFLAGREVPVINVGGVKISLSELERVVAAAVPLADAVAAVAVPHPILGEVPAVLISGAGVIDLRALRVAIADALGTVAVPRRVEVVACMPTNESGEIDRSAVTARFTNLDR